MYALDKSLMPTPAETRVFSPDLDGLIAWLSTQPGETIYEYMSPDDCLLCRFASVLAGRRVDFSGAADMGLSILSGGKWLERVAYPQWDEPRGPDTYARALLRARQYQAERV